MFLKCYAFFLYVIYYEYVGREESLEDIEFAVSFTPLGGGYDVIVTPFWGHYCFVG